MDTGKAPRLRTSPVEPSKFGELAGRRSRTLNPSAAQARLPGPGRRLLTLAEVADILGTSVSSVRRLIWRGDLPAVRLTRRIHVDVQDLDRLIERTKDRAPSWRGSRRLSVIVL
jgi:excisionase family DNA binding protein